MENIKLTATFYLPGASDEQRSGDAKQPKVTTFINVDGERVKVLLNKKKLAKQVVNMSDEAYKFMQTVDSYPESMRDFSKWKNMKKDERLLLHLRNMQDDLGAIYFTFTIHQD